MVVQEDLDRACKNINLCTQQGFSWKHKTYGCTKTEMNAWRALVSTTLEELKTHDSEQRNARFTAKQFNAKLSEVNWPEQINALTWQNYFMLWMQERDKFSSDWHRCAHLKSALSPQDREHFASFTNPDSIVYGLMVRYGNETDFVLSKLRELTSLRKPDPSDLTSITSNMNIMKRNLVFIMDLNHEKRLDSYTIRNIVNTAFDRHTLKEHNIQYMQFRSKHLAMAQVSCPGITPENFSLYFNSSSLINDRLGFLVCFIDQVLEYNRLLHHGNPTPSETCHQTHPPSLPLSDTWLCRLCKTSH